MIARIPHSGKPATLEAISAANPGWKIEREADGSLTMSPTGSLSGAHDVALIALLLDWQRHAGGQLFGSSTGFTMPDDSVLSPDASWISGDRWNAIPIAKRDEYVRLVPDICVEIASATDSVPDLIAKLRRYRGYGAGYVLFIDPRRRTMCDEGIPPPGFPTDFTRVFDAGIS